MKTRIENLREKLNDNLLPLRGIANPRERLNETIKVIGPAIATLKQEIENGIYDTNEEEIAVFKNTLPEFLALRIEEGLLYKMEINKPIGTTELQVKYYEEELKVLQSFFRLNAFHYQYYRNNFTELDSQFFLRNQGPLSISITEVADSDPDTSTPISYLFAKFIAYETIQYHILEKIAALKNPKFHLIQGLVTDELEIKWTGDITNLVELAYGIWLTGQLNNGNASLNQIVRWLENNLHVTIGIIQKRFAEIERRKRLSPTKYIDQMRDNILQKIENNAK